MRIVNCSAPIARKQGDCPSFLVGRALPDDPLSRRKRRALPDLLGYTVQFTRSYRDDQGNYHDSDSYSGSELLRIARLSQKAYDYTAELRDQNAKA